MQVDHITPREKEVLELVAHEHTTPEIASKLYLSSHTIESHKKNIKYKLNARNTAGMVRRGFELGLLRVASQSLALLGLFIILYISCIQVAYGQQEIELRTDGIVVPRLEPFDVINPTKGQLIFENEDLNELMFYDGSNWQRLFNPVFENQNGLIRQTSENGDLNQSFVFGAFHIPNNLNVFNDTLFFFDRTNGAFGGGIYRPIIAELFDDTDFQRNLKSNGVFGIGSFSYGFNAVASGNYSFATGARNTASGFSSSVFGLSNIASANYSTAFGYSTRASGSSSTAFGELSTASGARSTAFGRSTLASGSESTAFGELTEASGIRSVAFGLSTRASGTDAVTFGIGTEASGTHSASFGNSTIASSVNTTAFGTESVANELNATAFGDSTIANGINSSSFGSHTFATAENATAFGNSTEASGDNAVAMGFTSNASGYLSMAAGFATQASGNGAVALGSQNQAIGHYSFTSGIGNEVHANFSAAFGEGNHVNAYSSFVAGRYNDTIVANTPFGLDKPLFIIGNGTMNSDRSNALVVRQLGNVGINVDSAVAKLEVATNSVRQSPTLELHQTNEGGADSFVRQAFSNHSSDEKWFIVASPSNTPSSGRLNFYHTDGAGGEDVLKLEGDGDAIIEKDLKLNNGNLTVNGTGESLFEGDLKVVGTFSNPSDIRYKKDIVPLKSALVSITNMGGYRYNWKDENKPEPQIGLIAQEVQAVYPELVKEDEEGMLSVSYTKMVPVLLEAIKEQQKLIKSLEERLDKLENQ